MILLTDTVLGRMVCIPILPVNVTFVTVTESLGVNRPLHMSSTSPFSVPFKMGLLQPYVLFIRDVEKSKLSLTKMMTLTVRVNEALLYSFSYVVCMRSHRNLPHGRCKMSESV